MTLHEILKQTKTLSPQERTELVKLPVDSLDVPATVAGRSRHLSELRGLGTDIWEGIDAQTYVDVLRDEWDNQS